MSSTWDGQVRPEVLPLPSTWPRPCLLCIFIWSFCLLRLSQGGTGGGQRGEAGFEHLQLGALLSSPLHWTHSPSSLSASHSRHPAATPSSLKPTWCPAVGFSSDTDYTQLCRSYKLKAQPTRLPPSDMPAARLGSSQATYASAWMTTNSWVPTTSPHVW